MTNVPGRGPLIADHDFNSAYERMESGEQSLFITGRAGTGKSTLLNHFRQHSKRKHIVLAPTGIAAINVGGSTIHSFFGFPLRPMVPFDPDIRTWSSTHPRTNVLKRAQTIIIDEVSMVRSDIFNAMDYCLRLNMNIDEPFGGKQIILIGDIFQLPPVYRTNEFEAHQDVNESPYFFDSESYRQLDPSIIELRKVHRQHNEHFISLLNKIRSGWAGASDLDEINERFSNNHELKEFTILLASTNSIVDQVNEQHLHKLRGNTLVYKAIVEGNFPTSIFPTHEHLSLKVGAQVMMIKNDHGGRWVNGTIGKIVSLSQQEVQVALEDGSVHQVLPATWENKNYTWDKKTNAIDFTVAGTFKQFPLKLAWAITIHKSQGLTFDRINIDLGRGAFAHGQLYVALSRCRTLEGINLLRRISENDLIVDELVSDFARRHKIG